MLLLNKEVAGFVINLNPVNNLPWVLKRDSYKSYIIKSTENVLKFLKKKKKKKFCLVQCRILQVLEVLAHTSGDYNELRAAQSSPSLTRMEQEEKKKNQKPVFDLVKWLCWEWMIFQLF